MNKIYNKISKNLVLFVIMAITIMPGIATTENISPVPTLNWSNNTSPTYNINNGIKEIPNIGYKITVTAYPLWTHTGLYVNAGDTIYVTASGIWNIGFGSIGPDGFFYPCCYYDQFLVYPTALQGELIAFVGPDPYQGNWGNGNFFPQSSGYWAIGSGGQFVSDKDGLLWLGMNDDAVSKNTGDNSGSVLANVYLSSSGNINVISPNGGENWQRGTINTITWSSTGSPDTNVEIELLKTDSFDAVISSSTPNDGSYSWAIPLTQTIGPDYKIKITSISNPIFTDTSDNNFAISSGSTLGIDVSHWQGNINWASVHNAGYKFAFVKATEGVSFTDAKFITNMNNGNANGILMGAYHFARPDINNAVKEANHFVKVAKPYLTKGYLRPALDVERGSNLGKTALSNWINTWIDTVKSQTGVEPIVYMNSNYAKNYVDASVIKRNLWIAHWTYNPNINPNTGIWNTWNFWQYSNKGSVPGIADRVDLDKFNGPESVLNNFIIDIGNSVNLLKNPGFEESYNSLPKYWNNLQTGTKATFTYPETGKIGKSVTIKYTIRETGKVALWLQQGIVVSPNGQYKLSGYMKLQGVTGSTATPRPGGASIRVAWYKSDGKLIKTDVINKKGTIGWTKYEAVFKAPSNAVKATVGGDLFDSTGKVWFDNLEFIKIS